MIIPIISLFVTKLWLKHERPIRGSRRHFFHSSEYINKWLYLQDRFAFCNHIDTGLGKYHHKFRFTKRQTFKWYPWGIFRNHDAVSDINIERIGFFLQLERNKIQLQNSIWITSAYVLWYFHCNNSTLVAYILGPTPSWENMPTPWNPKAGKRPLSFFSHFFPIARNLA